MFKGVKECIRRTDENYSHIPYRGSKLTSVLRDCFSKKYNSIMIATICSNQNNYHDIINTLDYSNKVCTNNKYNNKYNNKINDNMDKKNDNINKINDNKIDNKNKINYDDMKDYQYFINCKIKNINNILKSMNVIIKNYNNKDDEFLSFLYKFDTEINDIVIKHYELIDKTL